MKNIMFMVSSMLYLNIPKSLFYCKVMLMKFVESDFFEPVVKEAFKMLNL